MNLIGVAFSLVLALIRRSVSERVLSAMLSDTQENTELQKAPLIKY